MRAEQRLRHPASTPDTQVHRFNGDSATRAASEPAPIAVAPADAAGVKPADEETLKRLLLQFAELRAHMSLYANARIDGAKASVRHAATRLVAAALGFVAIAGLVVLASWFVLSGVATGLGTLFGNQAWIGPLLTGLATLVGVGAGMRFMVAARTSTALKRMVAKYEARHAEQRSRLGGDAHDGTPVPIAKDE